MINVLGITEALWTTLNLLIFSLMVNLKPNVDRAPEAVLARFGDNKIFWNVNMT